MKEERDGVGNRGRRPGDASERKARRKGSCRRQDTGLHLDDVEE